MSVEPNKLSVVGNDRADAHKMLFGIVTSEGRSCSALRRA